MQTNACEYEFLLDNLFFTNIDAPEVQKGKVNVSLKVKKTAGIYELNFQTDGLVWVPCDRCLDEMEQPVSSADKLFVKFGSGYAEEKNNVVVIPEEEGEINVAWFMYEFVALCIPMKHVHAPGKCNKTMMGKLSKHLKTNSSDESEEGGFMEEPEELDTEIGDVEDENPETDPRWNELKKILDNN